MSRVTFRAKVETMFNPDDTPAYKRIKVPEFTQSHCDMNAFRRSPRFSGLANSNMFPAILKRASRAALGLGDYFQHIRLDAIPSGVTVDTSGFLAVVSFDLSDERS